MRLYLDAVYVAKCYLHEPDGTGVRELAQSASGSYSSSICIAEMACIFHRHLREGRLSPEEAAAHRRHFSEDLSSGVWELIPATVRLLERVDALVQSLPADCLMRAGDSPRVSASFRLRRDMDQRPPPALGCRGRRHERTVCRLAPRYAALARMNSA